MSGVRARLAARLVHLTFLVDRAYQRFDRLRSLVVLAFGSDRFFEAYSDVAYGSTPRYFADSPEFRRGLFPWERDAIAAYFPPPPARVLVGAAGGGREAYALVGLGYSVVAFDPVQALAESMRRGAAALPVGALEVYCAKYEDLPLLRTAPAGSPVDLRAAPPFDASIAGWSSLPHLRSDEARVETLRQLRALTAGPILISYFSREEMDPATRPRTGLIGALKRHAFRHGAAMFGSAIGYARLLSDSELTTMAEQAGLEIVHLDRERAWPHAVLRRKSL